MIVGIGYRKRRGKDTGADALVRDLGFVKVGFADALKRLALETNPIVVTEPAFENVRHGHNTLRYLVEHVGWEYAKDHYPQVRLFLQQLGTGARTVFGDDFWIGKWYEQALALGGDVVVPDVRYRNEAEYIKEAGGFLIRIDRPVSHLGSDGHPSETELDGFDGWDAVIANDGSIVDLEREIVKVVRGARVANQIDAGELYSPENVKAELAAIDAYPRMEDGA